MENQEQSNEVNEEVKNVSEETQEVQTEANEVIEPTQPTEDFKAKYDEMNDRYLRLYSEFDNYRRRTSKERIELIGSASEDVLKSVIPVLDDLERAVVLNQKIEDIQAIKEGFELVFNKLKVTLSNKGLKEMKIEDGVFNADFHEAITKIPAPTPELKGKIIDTIEKGYYLNDKIIRFAKVVVGE